MKDVKDGKPYIRKAQAPSPFPPSEQDVLYFNSSRSGSRVYRDLDEICKFKFVPSIWRTNVHFIKSQNGSSPFFTHVCKRF